jgi:hypothetical protein
MTIVTIGVDLTFPGRVVQIDSYWVFLSETGQTFSILAGRLA